MDIPKSTSDVPSISINLGLSDVFANILLLLGVDQNGRPVVVFIGRYFPAHAVDLNKV